MILFWILSVISVGSAILMITNRNPVRSALYLVLTFLCVAVFYITLEAQFIAAVQVIVYAGAIMVLFLFVIMLLNLGAPHALRETRSLQPAMALAFGSIFLLLILFSRSLLYLPGMAASEADAAPMGTVQGIGQHLYSPAEPWLFPFEITSVLLLTAVVGAIVMAKRRI